MPESEACVLGDGAVVDLRTATAEQLQQCKLQVGAVLQLEEEDSSPPLTQPAPPVVAPPAPAPRPTFMEPVPSAPVEAAPVAEAPAPAPAPDATTEQIEVPAASPSPSELGNLIAASGGGALGLVAALIAVVGGTAGFKLWTKISEQKHEQSMKKLDIEQSNAGLSGAQPPPCQSAHQTLVADIKALQGRATSLEARVEKLEKASAGFDPSVDVGDLEERVEVLEKSFRKKARATDGGV
jgi:hypothetical protein